MNLAGGPTRPQTGPIFLNWQKLVARQLGVRVDISIYVHVHHVVDSSPAVVILLMLPATGARDGEVVDDSRRVLTGCQHISHARLINIKATQLRYLSFVLLSLIKLNVLSCTLYVPLQGFALLRLWLGLSHLSLRLYGEGLLHTVAGGHQLHVARKFLNSWVMLHLLWLSLLLRLVRHRQLPLSSQRAVKLSISCLLSNLLVVWPSHGVDTLLVYEMLLRGVGRTVKE